MAGLIFPTSTATNFRDFVPGDSTYLKNTTRIGHAIELFNIIHKGTQEYNRQNPGLQVAASALTFDTETKQISGSMTLPYQEVSLGVYKVQNTIEAYLPVWTTPTTGEFTGVDSPLDALVQAFRYINYVARLLETSSLYNSPVGFFDVQDNATAQSYSLTINTDLIYATDLNGNVVIKADNWADIVDKQQALV